MIVAILALVIANFVTVGTVIYQQRAQRTLALESQKIEFINRQLEEFYNPILALLTENGEVFKKTGPPTFPSEPRAAEAAAEFWSEMRDQFILPNNIEVSRIISEKSHLISKNDNLGAYMRLKLHIDAYTVFKRVKTEAYKKFTYPTGVEKEVEKQRNSLINDLARARGDL